MNQIDREEKEIKQCLDRLREERELLLQIDAVQGDQTGFVNFLNRLFHVDTKLAIMALMPTLYSHIFCSFFHYLYLKMLVNVKLDAHW